MDTSTYFGLNLVTGSDKVNPLTVDRPNYEKIDEQMHKNQIASVVEATELKSGTVHAITCLTDGAVFFRFTATSDYAAGDTFTFNGAPVSAVLPDGSGLQQGAFKINGTVLCSIIGTLLTVYSFTASGIAADSEKLGGQLPAYYAKATDAISTYVHSRIGTVNNFVGTGANGKVKFASNIQPGDTVQINGNAVSAYAGVDVFVNALAGKDIVGKTALFVYDSTSQTVTFAIAGFDAAAGYSTGEQPTGETWIDGKTIYKKTYTGTSNVSSVLLESDASYIDKILDAKTSVTNTAGVQYVPGATGFANNSLVVNNQYLNMVRLDTNGKLSFETTKGVTPTYSEWFVTVYYTKK